MAKTTTTDSILLNDGFGNLYPIATGTFASKAIDMSERRRISLTGSFAGGYTGILSVQGTDEVPNCIIVQGTGPSVAWAGAGAQPGQNGYTGALYWQNLPSGSVNVTNSTSAFQLQLTDVGVRFVRLVFNQGVVAPIGSGTIQIFLTAKHT